MLNPDSVPPLAGGLGHLRFKRSWDTDNSIKLPCPPHEGTYSIAWETYGSDD